MPGTLQVLKHGEVPCIMRTLEGFVAERPCQFFRFLDMRVQEPMG